MQLNRIYNEDNLSTMKRMPESFISGIICSPPYNITTKRKDCYYNNGYSEIDNLSDEDYLNLRINEFKEFSRVLDNHGVICYNISYHNENPILPTLLISKIHQETDLTIADIITWKKSNSIPFQTSPTKLSRICELIYIIVKKKYLHNFRTNKQVSKINKDTGQKFYKNYTNLIEAKNNDGIKSTLKASYSEELVDKLINIYFPKDSIIYDPFSGLGTTARSCKKNSLKFIGSELNKVVYLQSIELINT
jgi:DNA modification methylase